MVSSSFNLSIYSSCARSHYLASLQCAACLFLRGAGVFDFKSVVLNLIANADPWCLWVQDSGESGENMSGE